MSPAQPAPLSVKKLDGFPLDNLCVKPWITVEAEAAGSTSARGIHRDLATGGEGDSPVKMDQTVPLAGFGNRQVALLMCDSLALQSETDCRSLS
jgi:hypothetical protein